MVRVIFFPPTELKAFKELKVPNLKAEPDSTGMVFSTL
jgi:hypothetical protein